jgi:peptide/nickel transport system substrate-binding protein
LPLGRRALSRALAFGLAAPLAPSSTDRLAAAQEDGDRPPSSAGPTAPPGEPLPDGRLAIGATVEPDSLHPWEADEAAASNLLDGVVEGLLKVNAAGRLQPALAEGFTLADDGVTYTFSLREGVRFHNGEPFAGGDVVAAWEARLDGAWSGAATLGWDRVAGIDLPDERTLTVSTREPYAPFLSTVGVAPILPVSAYADGLDAFRERYAAEPVGTGPFRVGRREPGRRIDLARWDDYWGGPALLESIRYEVVPDADALRSGLGTGGLDLVSGPAPARAPWPGGCRGCQGWRPGSSQPAPGTTWT